MGLFDFLASKPDHPLGGLAQARKVAAELARADARVAVDEASAWLESLAGANGFSLERLTERILMIEGAAVPQVRRLGRDYLALPAGSLAATMLWDAGHRFWSLLSAAHMHVIDNLDEARRSRSLSRAQLAHVYAAALNAAAAIQKWQQYRYRRLPDSYWEGVGKLYLAACERGIALRHVELYDGYGETSVEGEYLRTLLFHVASMDTLPPTEIEVGERLIAHFLPRFKLTRDLVPGSAYWVEAGMPRPPSRLVTIPAKQPNQRFFKGDLAQAERDALIERIRAAGAIPAGLALGASYAVEDVLKVLEHLGMSWSAKPPVRSQVRRPVQAPLAVIHGFDEAMRTIAYAASEERTRIPDLELWSVSDVSLGGMAIHGTLGHNPWPCIGMLVTMKPDGNGNWLVGVVRRFSRNPEQAGDEDSVLAADPNYASLGIETLSRAPAAVIGDANGLRLDILVLDMPVVGECCRFLVPPNSMEPTIPVTFNLGGQAGRVMPQKVLEQGPDYVLVSGFVQSFY